MTVDKAKGLDSLARAQTELATCWNRIHRCSRKASVGVHLCALGVRRAQKGAQHQDLRTRHGRRPVMAGAAATRAVVTYSWIWS